MADVTPFFTDTPVEVLPAQTLTRAGTPLRGTLDLSNKYGAFLYCKIGRGGTSALSAGIEVLIRRVLANDAAAVGNIHSAPVAAFMGETPAGSGTNVNVTSNSGQNNLQVASVIGFAAGDLIMVQDGAGTFTRLEFHRVSRTQTGLLVLDRPLHFTHTSAQADIVRNRASIFAPVWVMGGSLVEVIFDYGAATTGEVAVIAAHAQTYDKDVIT